MENAGTEDQPQRDGKTSERLPHSCQQRQRRTLVHSNHHSSSKGLKVEPTMDALFQPLADLVGASTDQIKVRNPAHAVEVETHIDARLPCRS